MDKRLRFGVFELDVAAGELQRHGQIVRIQHQPLQLLIALVEHPGAVVTRDELKRRLWPDGITVDFDQSLNKCVTKVRDALRDTAGSPRFVETLPRRGYRFIADVTPAAPPIADSTPQGAPRWRSWTTILAAVAITLSTAISFGSSGAPAGRPTRATVATPAFKPIHAARDAYERGRVAISRPTAENLRAAVQQFQRAVQLSPRYADAHVGLADAWSLQASYGLLDPRDAMPRARDATNRALMLDPSLAAAHASLARTAMIFDLDWPTAEWHFRRAITLDPGAPTTRQWFAYLLSAQARHDEAVAEANRAVLADPQSLNANTALGYVLYLARRYGDAAAQLTRTLEIDPGFAQARRNLALVQVQQGRIDHAVQALARVAAIDEQSPAALAELAWAHGLNGNRREAARLVAQLVTLRERLYVPPDALALAHLGAGDRARAIDWLKRAVAMKVAAMANLAVEPMWDATRAELRD